MTALDLGLRILVLLSPVLLAALAWASARLAQFITAHVKNAYLKNALVRLDDAVFSAVKELEQTLVAEVKASSGDGKLSAADCDRIKRAAMDKVKSYLGMKGIAEIATILGLSPEALDGVIGTRIEAAVHDVRAATAAIAAKAPAPTAAAPAGGSQLPLAPSPAA
ncbi:MAG: hypothetical protein ACYCWW_07865 [Deltaproteobacteria bacterium]